MKYHSNKTAPVIPAVRKQCYFCTTNSVLVDYKDNELLRTFMNPQSKIMSKRRTGVCATHQRQLSRAIKRARVMGVVPFTTR